MAEIGQPLRSLFGGYELSQQCGRQLLWTGGSKLVKPSSLAQTFPRGGSEIVKSTSGNGAACSISSRQDGTSRRGTKIKASRKEMTASDLAGSIENDSSQYTFVEGNVNGRALNGHAGGAGSYKANGAISGRTAVNGHVMINGTQKHEANSVDSINGEFTSYGNVSNSSEDIELNGTSEYRDSLSERRSYTGSNGLAMHTIKRRGLRGMKALRDSQFASKLWQFMKEANMPIDALPSAKRLDQLGRKDLADGMRLLGMKTVRQLVLVAAKAEPNNPNGASTEQSSTLPKSPESWISNWSKGLKPNFDGSNGAGIESPASFREEREKRLEQLKLIQQTAALLLDSGVDKKKSEVRELPNGEVNSAADSASKAAPRGSELWSEGIDAVARQKAALLKASLLRRTLSSNALTVGDLSNRNLGQTVGKSAVPSVSSDSLQNESGRTLEADRESLNGSLKSKPDFSTGPKSEASIEAGSAVHEMDHSRVTLPNGKSGHGIPTTMLDMLTADSQAAINDVEKEVKNGSVTSFHTSSFQGPQRAERVKDTPSPLALPSSFTETHPANTSVELEPHPTYHALSHESGLLLQHSLSPSEAASALGPADIPNKVDYEFVDFSKPSQQQPGPSPTSVPSVPVDNTKEPPTKFKPSLLEAAKKFRQSAAFNTFKVFTPVPLPPTEGYMPDAMPTGARQSDAKPTIAGESAENQDETIRLLRKENEELFHDIRVKQQEMEAVSLRERRMQEEFKRVTQTELLRIKSALEAREAELASMVMEFDEAKGQFALMRSKAMAELHEVQHSLTEKEAHLKSAEAALAKLKQVKVEYWGLGEHIQLGGNFNGWMHHMDMEPDLTSAIPQPDGSRGPMMWEIELYLYPGAYQIKFIIDGDWVVDTRRDVIMNGSVQNNLLVVDV